METILSVLNKAADFLSKRGVPDARLDAGHLIAHGLDLKRMDLYLNFEKPLAEAELAKLRPLIARRAKREPLQHIIGNANFRGHKIICDKRALIPRPETELMLDILGKCEGTILEIGTGTGALAVSAALEMKVKVIATDISKDAISLAGENVALHHLEQEISLLCCNLLADIPKAKYNALLANLPYIPDNDINQLEPEVKDYDPHTALFGGKDGLDVIRSLLNVCAEYLAENAPVILEIASGQEKILEKQTFPGLKYIKAHKDFAGKTRFAQFACANQ